MDESTLDDLTDQLDENISVLTAKVQDDITNILIRTEMKPSEIYDEFHKTLIRTEKKHKQLVNESYYLIEQEDAEEEYMIEIREQPDDVVFYIPKISFESNLNYQQMNDCYTVADLVEEKTSISDNHQEMQIAITILCLYLIDVGKLDIKFDEFKILGHQIYREEFTEIARRISSEIEGVGFEVDDNDEQSTSSDSAFDW